MDPDEVFLCHQCGKVFYKLSTLESHAKWKHMEKTNEFMCDQCGRTFQKKYNLIKHLDSGYHDVTETVNCALCNFRAQNRKFMGEHYQKFHEIRLSESNVYFKNPEEFFTWKNEFENKTRSRFVKMSSTRKRKNGFMRSTYFCHRDGNFIPKGRNLRHLKRMGSNKINAHCPAKMDVDIGENVVAVSYIDTHLGHELDITRMNLDLTDRALIAKKLASKVPFETILEEINSSAQDNELKRVNLLTRKDLWNIVDTFKINPKTVVYSKNRVRRKKKMDRPKKEPRKNRVFYKVMEQDSNSSVDDSKVVYSKNDEGDHSDNPVTEVEKENVILCPVVLKDNEYVQEFTVIGDDSDGDTGTCLIINAQGELESISGHRVVFTEDGMMEICEDPVVDEDYENRETVVMVTETGGESGEVSGVNEEETDVCEHSLESDTRLCEKEVSNTANATNSLFEIRATQKENGSDELISQDNKGAVVKRQFVWDNVSEYTIKRKQKQISVLKEKNESDHYAVNNFEEVNEQPPLLPVEELSVEHRPEYEVTIESGEEENVNEFVIISTNEEELKECSVIPNKNYAQQDFDQIQSPLLPIETVILKGIKEEPIIKEEVVDTFVAGEELVEVCEPVEQQWDKKRKRVLHKILNVHNMINNEQQFNVFSKNISSLENVLKALNNSDETVPQSSDCRVLDNKSEQMDR